MSDDAMTPALQRELEQLLNRLLDEQSSDEQSSDDDSCRLADDAQARLAEMLSRHVEARRLYLDYFAQHNDLYWLDQQPPSEQRPYPSSGVAAPTPMMTPPIAPPTARTIEPARASGLSKKLIGPLSVAALAASVLLMWVMTRNDSSARPAAASIVGEQNAVWGASGRIGSSRELASGPLALREGRAELRMSDAHLTLLAPVEADIIDDHTVRVIRGRVRLEIGPAAIGFRVLTSTMDVVDLGTEFGVSVDEEGATEVHVFKGVVVASNLGRRQVVPIYENEAGLAVDDGSITGIEVNPTQFAIAPKQSIAAPTRKSQYTPIDASSRVVVLGDESFDKETPLLLVEQAFNESGQAGPKFVNAAMRSDYRKRFESRVLRFRPTHVVLSLVTEQALRIGEIPPPEENFERATRQLIDMIHSAGAEVILMTGYLPNCDNRPQARERVRAYNEVVRGLAAEQGYRLADVEELWREAADETALLEGIGRLPSFAGFRVLAQSLLEALGYPELAVPDRLTLSLLTGAITNWEYRFVPATETSIEREPLAPSSAEGGWSPLVIPQADLLAGRAREPSQLLDYQNRQRGFATNLITGGRQRVEATAIIDSPTERDAFLNVGGKLQVLWLNGECVYQRKEWGWTEHAGRERVPVRLRTGANRIVIKTSNSFFVSLTDGLDW